MKDAYLRSVQIGLIATFVGFQVNQSFNGDSQTTCLVWRRYAFAVQRVEKMEREKTEPLRRVPEVPRRQPGSMPFFASAQIQLSQWDAFGAL